MGLIFKSRDLLHEQRQDEQISALAKAQHNEVTWALGTVVDTTLLWPSFVTFISCNSSSCFLTQRHHCLTRVQLPGPLSASKRWPLQSRTGRGLYLFTSWDIKASVAFLFLAFSSHLVGTETLLAQCTVSFTFSLNEFGFSNYKTICANYFWNVNNSDKKTE